MGSPRLVATLALAILADRCKPDAREQRCRAGESLDSAYWRWRPLPIGDTLVVQAAGDEGIVLRLYVTVWHGQDDAESAKQDAVK